ncbi:hypothetical protein [Actinomycetospora sp. TBRC 11914]|uniref:hypothetical protein n=1 Tax=Actinomycetospora sp. TBRC 11914 TaxID=2729387 RepID=UPI00145DCC88|nr:hypothetical protein [Actinomycetospora sp. TBRC 11914]NMO89526.1 hypothetical protein [Actinomycetospora sp. TBRC 11914]
MDRSNVSRLYAVIIGTVTALLLLALVGPATFLTADQYQGYGSAVQAFGVVLALLAAVAAVRSDTRDRRVDRTIGLHRELIDGPVHEARIRLWTHLKPTVGRPECARSRFRDLRTGDLASYSGDEGHTPIEDVNTIFRLFERVEAMRTAGVTDERLLFQLLGRHALWWRSAIIPSENEALDPPLSSFVDWVVGSPRHASVVEMWRAHQDLEFGPPYEPAST